MAAKLLDKVEIPQDRFEMRLSGSGGQGMILAAVIMSEAIGGADERSVVQSQSYGPEARGGASKSDVVVSENEIFYPKAIPQYEVGYGRFKQLMDEAEQQAPGLFFAGHYREGISLGDSIVSGDRVTERIAAYLGNDAPARPLTA